MKNTNMIFLQDTADLSLTIILPPGLSGCSACPGTPPSDCCSIPATRLPFSDNLSLTAGRLLCRMEERREEDFRWSPGVFSSRASAALSGVDREAGVQADRMGGGTSLEERLAALVVTTKVIFWHFFRRVTIKCSS